VIGSSTGASNAVQAAPNWSAFSMAALEYRVIGIEMDFFPVNVVNTVASADPPAFMVTGTWSSGVAPTVLASIMEGANGKVHSGFRPFRATASAKGNNDALLWTSINAAIPSSEAYGIVMGGTATAPGAPATAVMYRTITRWVVQFRTLQ
jgi:hypothetical protein